MIHTIQDYCEVRCTFSTDIAYKINRMINKRQIKYTTNRRLINIRQIVD